VSLREEFCRLATADGANMSVLCERFEISRKTGYKWVARYRAQGVAGLADHSRRPKKLRDVTSTRMTRQVLAVRDEHPAWGGRKIQRRLVDLGSRGVPAPSTITAILRRHGRLPVDPQPSSSPCQRFERNAPNELWQMDFKGEFRLTPGSWCYPLTLLDDHSRYSLVLAACGNQRRVTVLEHLQAAFRRYGLPRAMLMDNGPPWGVPQLRGGATKLSVWLMDLDIDVLHGRPYHPQTQGKEERFHRTLSLEVLQGRQFDSLAHAQRRFDPWRKVYNHERPHEALGLAVPATRYVVSQRTYLERPAEFTYDASLRVRRIDREGRLVYGNREYYLSRAFSGRNVGIRPTEEDGVLAVYYRTFRIATLRPGQSKRRRGLVLTRSARQNQTPTKE
jgi:transposase InsO family protein